MKRKLKLSILSFLTFICMFSVGFSSWTLTGGSSSSKTTGSIYVDEVKRPTLVTINITEELQYFGNGFVDGGNDLKANVIVNLDNCVSYLLNDEEATTLCVDISLDYVKGLEKDNYLLSLAKLSIQEKSGIRIDGNKVYIDLNNESSGSISFEVTYTFNISGNDKDVYFKEGSILFSDNVFVILGKISKESKSSIE